MRAQYDGWIAGSHRAVAVCNDCHTPPGLVGKYATKALNGFWHSFAFTTGRFHEPIGINARNHAVTETACRHCHAAVVEAIDTGRHGTARLTCTGCHASVGHLQ
jgi:cytochrome c nitrite reductase small subunit